MHLSLKASNWHFHWTLVASEMFVIIILQQVFQKPRYLYNDDDEYDNFYGAITQHMPLQGCLDKNHVTWHRYASGKNVVI